MATTPASAEPLLEDFAARLARRDQPLAYKEPHGFAPGQVQQRIAAALLALLPGTNSQSRSAQARLLYHFISQETATGAELAAVTGRGRAAVARAIHSLLDAGLLRRAFEGPLRRCRLTRYGEDWLLAVSKGEAVPARPEPAPTS